MRNSKLAHNLLKHLPPRHIIDPAEPFPVLADALALKYKDLLVGRIILTEPYGEWPGGAGKVIEVVPDVGEQDIPVWIEALDLIHDEQDGRGPQRWVIGVFDHEFVWLLAAPVGRKAVRRG